MPTLLNYALLNTNTASDADASERYGSSVAISADGLVMAIGAREWGGATYFNAGKVYIYDRTGGAWVERNVIESPNQVANNIYFGTDVSLSSDGNILVVGSPGEGNDGVVHTYTRNGSSWDSETKLDAPTASSFNDFGFAVAISGDATVLIVQEINTANGSVTGVVYVYDRSGGAWSKRSTDIEPSFSSGNFGTSLFLSDDGAEAFLGSDSEPAEVYDYDNPGWSSRVTFESSDRVGGHIFGRSIAYAESSGKILVGASERDESVTGDGVVYAFTISGAIVTEVGYFVTDATPVNNDYFGTGVGVDSAYTIIGAGKPEDDDAATNAGAVETFDPVVWDGSGALILPLVLSGVGESATDGSGALILPLVLSGVGSSSIDGSGALTLDFTLTGKANFREYFVSHLDGQYALSAGFIKTISHLDGQYALGAYVEKTDALDGQYKLKAFVPKTFKLDAQYALRAFVKHINHLDGQYALKSVKEFIKHLDGQFSLNAFVVIKSFLEGQYALKALKEKVSHLDGQYQLLTVKEWISHLDGQYKLKAFVPQVNHLDGEYKLNAVKVMQKHLDGEYSLKAVVERISHLDGSYQLKAFKEVVSHLDGQYKLKAYEAVIAFLDACYQLRANELYYTYTTNLDIGAITEYTGFDFNSMSGNIGCTDTGLFTLEGADDDGVNIDLSLETGKFDFGSSLAKTLTDAYLGVSSDGGLKLTIVSDDEEISYTLSPGTTLKTEKQDLDKGVESRYFRVRVENINGSTMELDNLEVLLQLLNYRV